MRLYRYWKQCVRCRRQAPQPPAWGELGKWYREWGASLAPGRSSMSDERPWITFAAAAFLESRLNRASRIFEWGSGGSSLFFARRAGNVVSVEHDGAWFERVRETMNERGLTNWQGYLELPEPDASTSPHRADAGDSYVSSDPVYRGFSFRSYASRIDSFPDGSFDLIMLDGRARPSCLPHALPKLSPGGCLVWDNSDRAHYGPVIRTVPTVFERRDFPGPTPYLREFSQTTVWIHGG